MIILIIVVFLTLFISANCSLYEAVLYSTRVGALEAAKTKHKIQKNAQRFLHMKKNISEPIAAILIMNTLANTAGATLSGMFATKELGATYVPFFSIAFTLAILFFSEIMPKTVGVTHWRGLWSHIVIPVNLMRIFLHPAVTITQKFSKLFTKGQKHLSITEDEILALVNLGAREGEISEEESHMVQSIINLENKMVKDIMTPRTMIFSLNANLTIEEALKQVLGKGITRVPVYRGDVEKIIGYIRSPELSTPHSIQYSKEKIETLVKPITFVPATVNCLIMLTRFLKFRRHIAVVIDEFGGVAGIITLEDLIETALGSEIVDETDQFVDLQEEAKRRKKRKV